MKKYYINGKFIVLFLAAVMVVGLAIGARPLLRSWWHPVNAPESVTEETPRFQSGDAELLRQVIAIYRRIDTLSVIDMGGSIRITDPAEPTENVNATFNYCRRKAEMYYQLGDNEMVQLEGMCISANRGIEKLFVSPPKEVIAAPQLPVDSIISLWESDSYAINTTHTDNLTTIQLLCERHVTCKELKITYDHSAGKLNSIYMRLTNLEDPLNRKLDREITTVFNKWNEVITDDHRLQLSTYLQKEADGWKPAAAYNNFRLISTL
ncbi:hypothetical protein [Chitinophaga arvensicola]|uniref:Uncharacterized protein n=1 Tax=Chitinophaga arvensicola TaxID=29529 RepID=A0A1I0S9F0_9BACT|nr:hypothetical protein [Chitinophaga arvensicola]SEW52801.1 hypothetical protein SAMN04488122_5127 [Chitinophaga arvensicola]